MQTGSLNGRIGLLGLLTTLLMLHTRADNSIITNSQYQDDFYLSSSIPLGDSSAGPFGNLLEHDGPKIDSGWATDDAGLKLNSNPQDGNTEPPLLADASIACPNQGRLRQSRQGKRDQREQTGCKWPYSETTTTTTPEAQEGAPSPGKQQPGKPWPKLTDKISPPELWLRLFTARGVEAESNLKICNRYGLFPVCYPNQILRVPPLVSPAPLVEPCRFCKWIPLPYIPPDINLRS